MNSSKTTLVIRNLDLTARILDTASSVTQTSQLAGGLLEIVQWLNLERIDIKDLGRFCNQARDLFLANSRCEGFYNEVVRSEGLKMHWPLAFKQSGALGRIMVHDPYLAWIVSTTASLMHYHNEYFVVEAICMMILKSDSGNDDRPDYELRYLASRFELRSAIDKIVHSAWLNVINCGSNVESLPPEVSAVCSKNHHNLSADKLGVICHTLKKLQDKVIIESQYLLCNLTTWLLSHFHGTLLVSVSGKLIFDKVLGDAKRILELKIRSFCPETQDCSQEECKYRIYTDVRGSYTDFLNGAGPSAFAMPSTSKTRKSLYDILRTYEIGASLLTEVNKSACRQTAQLIVGWLLRLPLSVSVNADFGFSIKDLDVTSIPEAFTIGHILGRSPSILNQRSGNALKASVVYAPPGKIVRSPSPDAMSDLSFQSSMGRDIADFEYRDILTYFPPLQDLVKTTKEACSCVSCSAVNNFEDRTEWDRDYGLYIYPGCLAQAGVNFVFLLISHAVADSFGASDVSGTLDPRQILRAISTLFHEVLTRKQLRWDTCFNLAASVVLGCPFRGNVKDMKSGGTAYAAIQYGNLALVAPWLDMSAPLTVRNSFRFDFVVGKLGVSREDNPEKHFQGISEKFAIVQTERTEYTSSYAQRFSKWTEPLNVELKVERDNSPSETETMLVSDDDHLYRLITRFKSETSVRIINPVDTMIHLARSITFVECNHHKKQLEMERPKDNIKVYSFEDLLVRWQEDETFCGAYKGGHTVVSHGRKSQRHAPGLTYHLTNILWDQMQINVTTALTVNDLVILNQGQCCLPCAIKKATTMPVPENMKEKDVENRYIINVSPASMQLARGKNRPFSR